MQYYVIWTLEYARLSYKTFKFSKLLDGIVIKTEYFDLKTKILKFTFWKQIYRFIYLTDKSKITEKFYLDAKLFTKKSLL